MSGRDKRKSLAKAVDKAAAQFLSKPFASVRVADIAKEAGTSTATVFDAFESKRGLFAEALRRFLESGLPHLSARPEDGGTLEQMLGALARHAKLFSMPGTRRAFRLIGANEEQVSAEAVVEKRTRVEQHWDMIAAHCTRAMKARMLRAGESHEMAKYVCARLNYDTVFFGTTMRLDRDPPASPAGEAAVRALAPFLTLSGRKRAAAWLKK